MQKSKKCVPEIDRKKGGKKGGELTRLGSSAAAFARPEGMQDSCSRKVFAIKYCVGSIHATTPGGVRRIVFAYAKTAALH